MKRLVLRGLFVLPLLGISALGQGPAQYHLAPSAKTVTWGYFDPNTPAVLRIRSGNTVDVETLPAGASQALEAAGLPRDQMQPPLLEVEREVKDRGEVPHILTGPIWIEGAEPGDTLEVKILSIEPAVPYAWSGFMPGRGFLPDDFPYAHFKLTPLDFYLKGGAILRWDRDSASAVLRGHGGCSTLGHRPHQQRPTVDSWREHG